MSSQSNSLQFLFEFIISSILRNTLRSDVLKSPARYASSVSNSLRRNFAQNFATALPPWPSYTAKNEVELSRSGIAACASSMDERQPCMDDSPYLNLSFSPSSDTFSVLGLLRYVPIRDESRRRGHNPHRKRRWLRHQLHCS
uniref:Uncharacterized protein n=1 Tax=Opuntia streptacantha TaxID=393608 RepID=A0A7C9ESF5_OPUST